MLYYRECESTCTRLFYHNIYPPPPKELKTTEDHATAGVHVCTSGIWTIRIFGFCGYAHTPGDNLLLWYVALVDSLKPAALWFDLTWRTSVRHTLLADLYLNIPFNAFATETGETMSYPHLPLLLCTWLLG